MASNGTFPEHPWLYPVRISYWRNTKNRSITGYPTVTLHAWPPATNQMPPMSIRGNHLFRSVLALLRKVQKTINPSTAHSSGGSCLKGLDRRGKMGPGPRLMHLKTLVSTWLGPGGIRGLRGELNYNFYERENEYYRVKKKIFLLSTSCFYACRRYHVFSNQMCSE